MTVHSSKLAATHKVGRLHRALILRILPLLQVGLLAD